MPGALHCRNVLVSTLTVKLSNQLRHVLPHASRALLACSGGRCTFSSETTEQPEALSKRKQFKQIVVDPKLMRHLDLLDLGMEKGKVERTRKMRLYRRGAIASAAPGAKAGTSEEKVSPTFDHPTWAVKHLASISSISEVPARQGGLPEVALVGRSNVGKSTLLNALLGLRNFPQKAAKVSDTPGTTRTLDFYRLGKGSRAKLVLVDMPGYGFAYAEGEKREDWKGMTMAYLRGRGAPLKRVMLLLDARHGFKRTDLEFLEQLYDPKGPSPLGAYHPPKVQIVLTKCDLVNRVDLARRVTMVRRELNEVSRRQTHLATMMLSALRGQGLAELQRELSSLDPNPSASSPAERRNVEDASGLESTREKKGTVLLPLHDEYHGDYRFGVNIGIEEVYPLLVGGSTDGSLD